MSNFLIFKAAFNESATPAIGTYTAEGGTAYFNRNPDLSPDYYLYNTTDDTAVQWFVPTAETTDFEFVADILTREWTNRVTYFIIADSTGTTRLRMWSQHDNWHFENSDSDNTSGTEYIEVITPTTSGGFGVFHQFRVRVRKLTASSSSVEVYVDGTLKLTATAGAALVTCAKIGFVGGVNTFGPGTDAGVKNAYVYDLSGGDVIDRGVLSGAFNRFINWAKGIFALKSDIPTVNNGTLTIQQNGTNVQTFTANQSTAATANITVPTKTSDLTNDSGFITSDNTKIPLAGSNAISGSLIPSTDGTVNLGGSSYQWNNAYIKSLTINGVACGDILTHNVSEFVDVTSEQTISGTKTFSNLRTYFGRDISCYSVRKYGKNLNPASNTYQYINFSGNTVSDGPLNDWTGGYIEQVIDTNGGSRGRWFVQDTSENSTALEIWASSNDKQVRPLQSGNTDLGTANRKWKSFNGINPGALSLPGDAYIAIDTTNYAWGSNFTFTPDYDEYCFISIGLSGNSRVISLKTGRGEYYFSNQNNIFRFTFPVYKGKLVTIMTSSSGTESIIPTIGVFPCQGNV